MKNSPGPIIGADAGKRPAPRATDPGMLATALSPLVAFGLVLCGVGIVDLGMAWWPLRFGTAEWEFGMAIRTFNALALGTTGFVFLVVAASARGWVLGLRVLAGLSVIAFLLLVGTIGMFAMNTPTALAAVPEQTREAVERSIVRTSLFAVMYIALFGWLSWFTWRRASAEKGAP